MRIIIAVAILAAIASTSIIAQERIARTDRAAMRETREEMRKLANDLRAVQQTNGVFPDKLNAIIDADLREALPKDGWGNDFQYELSVEHGYKITSYGSDAKVGGENAARDIVWTRNGELRELTDEEQAELDARRDEQRYQAFRLIAVKRMVIVGMELVKHRREQNSWPESIDDFKPDEETKEDWDENTVEITKCFTDPWEREFTFKLLPHDNFAVVCYGRDSELGGKGRDADFVITERDVHIKYNDVGVDNWGGWRPNQDWQGADLASSVNAYKTKHGELPEELGDLTRGAQGQAIRFSIPTDRWGNQYVYVKLNDEDFFIASLGKDKIQGGIKDDADTLVPEPGKISADESNFNGGEGGFEVKVEPEVDENELLIEVADEVMRNICEQLNAHKTDNGNYPATLEEIAERLPGEEVPLDPWENAYVYEVATGDNDMETFTLTCLGSDGAEGGEDTGADFEYDHELVRTPPLNDAGEAEEE